MDATPGAQVQDDPSKKTKRKPGPNAGKGRRKGSKNKVTAATLPMLLQAHYAGKRETASDFWKDVLGIDTPRDGKINARAVRVRKRLREAIDGSRRLSPEYIALWRLGMSYAIGLPNKAEPDKTQKQRMPYIGRHGLPWQFDPMADQERLAIEAQKDQEKIDTLARERQLQGLPVDHKDDESPDPDAPEVVRG
jgi:hypothetical protein